MGDIGWKEECGICGIWGHNEAANYTYLALHALQHRGQESAGLASANGGDLYIHRGMGLVQDVFNKDILKRLKGRAAIGHVRYSTTGASHLRNAQPIAVHTEKTVLAVAHNGNLVNSDSVRRHLEAEGAIFQSTMDTEVIVHLIARSKRRNLRNRVIDALSQLRGSWCLVFLTPDRMIAARDPRGFRPLVLGKVRKASVVASESNSLDLIGGEFEREVAPGELLEISEKGVRSYRPFKNSGLARCIFEFIYFARPDSYLFEQDVYQVRKEFGKRLFEEQPVKADMVVPVPDSGLPAALGFSLASGINFEMGLVRSHYVGRTFIEPAQSIRHFGVKLKLNANKRLLKGKKIVLVDDSLVRGTTMRKLVKMIRAAGARQVHVRISAPPIIGSCPYGIDTPTRKELIASTHTVNEVRKLIGATSLGYLSRQGLLEAAGGPDGFCHACFSNEYPIEPEPRSKPAREPREVND